MIKSKLFSINRAIVLIAAVLLSFMNGEPKRLFIQDEIHIDSTRNRTIPIRIIALAQPKNNRYKGLILFSHGWDQNHGSAYKSYNFITNFMALKGYLVASVQHEQPSDEPLATGDSIRIKRMPNWERGAANLLFVKNTLLTRFREQLPSDKIILIGHSNGGDMSVLYTTKYPEDVSHLITYDNRRMNFPCDSTVKMLTLRSSNELPDPGVLDYTQCGLSIIPTKIIHNNFTNYASNSEKKLIRRLTLRFLEGE